MPARSTLFTGQWADLPLDDLAPKTRATGASTASSSRAGATTSRSTARSPTRATAQGRRELLERHGLGCWALGTHLVGQAVCDPIDARHRACCRPRCGATASPRACARAPPSGMKDTARAAAQLRRHRRHRLHRARRSGTCSTRSRPTTGPRSSAATRTSPSAGARSSTSSTPRACASRSRSTRPRSPTTSSPRARRSTRSAGARASGSTSTRATSSPSSWTRRRSRGVRRPHLPRPRQGLLRRARRPQRRSSASHLDFGEPSARLGLRVARPRRRRLRVAVPRAEPDRLRGPAVDRVGGLRHGPRRGARPTRWPSCAARDFAPSTVAFDAAFQRGLMQRRASTMAGAVGVTRADRRRDARLRLHGQGPLQRLPDPHLHDVAAAARAASWWRSAAATRRRSRRRPSATASRAHVTDWRELVADPRVELFDNLGPNNLHAEPTIAAAEAGKHVVCEKPLGRNADEAYETWQRVQAAGVKHMCAFNYRFVPAIRLAREMIEAGELGEIHHFRGALPAGLGRRPTPATWRLRQADEAGSGALGDLGAHIIDLARYLVGEIASVAGADADVRSDARAARSPSTTRSRRSSSSRAARSARSRRRASPRAQERADAGRSTARKGSMRVRPRAAERAAGHSRTTRRRTGLPHRARHRGRPSVHGSTGGRPGHIIGWEHTFVHELHHFLDRDRATAARAPARRGLRGRLPRRRGVRRDHCAPRPRAHARRCATGDVSNERS